MLNRSASLAMSTSVLKALPVKLDIKRHSPSILYILASKLLRDPISTHYAISETNFKMFDVNFGTLS